jgi:hypothetical protein
MSKILDVSTFVEQLPTLIGVIIGAFASYAATTTIERSRWKRRQTVRWDERRMFAYADYANSVKTMISIAHRIAAARGLPSDGNPLSPEEGLELLAKAEMERGSRWESVLLLGSSATISAGREWHQCAWTLEWFARGKLNGPEAYKDAYARADSTRANFYVQARKDLGVAGEFPDYKWTTHGPLDADETRGEKHLAGGTVNMACGHVMNQ